MKNIKETLQFDPKTKSLAVFLAQIEVEILLWLPLASGSHNRLQRIAGIAPKKNGILYECHFAY
jgi:hypothetical protein